MSRSCTRKISFIITIALATLAGRAMADRPEELTQIVAARLTELSKATREFEAIEDVKVQWRLTHFVPKTAEEIATIRQQIAKFPDHPDHEILKNVMREQEGSNFNERTIWLGGAGGFRLNDIDGAMPTDYYDRVSTPDQLWSMTRDALVLGDPKNPAPQANYQRTISICMGEVALLATGGLAQLDGFEFAVTSAVQAGPAIEFVARAKKAEVSVIVDGNLEAVSTETGSALVPSNIRVRLAEGVLAGELRWASAGWKFQPALLRPVAASVVEFADGRRTRHVTFVEATAVQHGAFASLTVLPPFDGDDPIRGKVTIRRIIDLRAGQPRTAEVIGGAVQAAVPQSESDGGRWWDSMRSIGWIVLGVGVIGIVVVKFRQLRMAGTR